LANVRPRDAELYSEVMTGAYMFHDMMLEALIGCAGEDVTLLLVSDHGFHSDKRRPSANAWEDPEAWHREFGVACAHGSGILRGETLYGATLLDVTPTVLALLGLPVGNDMDGRPWLEIFDGPGDVDRIESWDDVPGEAGLHPEELREDPTASADLIRRLVDLGYLEAPAGNAEETIGKAIRDARINLAVAVSTSRRAGDALQLWRGLVTDYPGEEGFRLQLASCLLRLGRWGESYDELEHLSDHLKHSPFVRLMLASIAAGEGRMGDALKIGREVAGQPTSDCRVTNRLGQLFLELKAWTDAAAAFQNSLALVTENPVALDGLAQVSMERGSFTTAIEQSLLAVGLVHFFPAAHFHLAEALARQGFEMESIAAYETALSMGYEPGMTHERLAALYRLRNPAKAKYHQHSHAQINA